MPSFEGILETTPGLSRLTQEPFIKLPAFYPEVILVESQANVSSFTLLFRFFIAKLGKVGNVLRQAHFCNCFYLKKLRLYFSNCYFVLQLDILILYSVAQPASILPYSKVQIWNHGVVLEQKTFRILPSKDSGQIRS
jgi:hypothetical protein